MEFVSRSGEIESILILKEEVVTSRLDLVDLASNRLPITPGHIYCETVVSPAKDPCFTKRAELVWLMLTR